MFCLYSNQVKVHEAKSLPKDLSHFVFCQYSFWGYEDPISVPPEMNPETSLDRKNTKTIKFSHERVSGSFDYVVTIIFLPVSMCPSINVPLPFFLWTKSGQIPLRLPRGLQNLFPEFVG